MNFKFCQNRKQFNFFFFCYLFSDCRKTCFYFISYFYLCEMIFLTYRNLFSIILEFDLQDNFMNTLSSRLFDHFHYIFFNVHYFSILVEVLQDICKGDHNFLISDIKKLETMLSLVVLTLIQL